MRSGGVRITRKRAGIAELAVITSYPLRVRRDRKVFITSGSSSTRSIRFLLVVGSICFISLFLVKWAARRE
jgi:hypothetical protein